MDQAQGALRDLKLIFLDSKFKTSRKNSNSKKSTAHVKKHENPESLIFNPYISNFELIIVTILHYLEFRVLHQAQGALRDLK